MHPLQDLPSLHGEVERLRMLATEGASLLDAIIDHSSHGIIVTDLDAKLVLRNRSAEQIDFRPLDWHLDRCLRDGASPERSRADAAPRDLARTELGARPHSSVEVNEVEVERVDGSRSVLLGSTSPIFDREARISGALIVFVDITKQVEARAHVSLLQSIIAAMSKARTVREVIDTVVAQTQAALRASSVSIAEIATSDALESTWSSASDRSMASVPLKIGEEQLGTMTLIFAERRDFQEEERRFIEAVAEHCAQALDRARLYDREARARQNAEQLFLLSNSLNRANTIGDVLRPSLTAVTRALGVDRAAILLFDERDVMRFREWIGLSDDYRAAVDGHSPWSRDERSPRPIFISDTERDPSVERFRAVFRREGIRAIGFVPLVQNDLLLGKLMVYADQPRTFFPADAVLALTICSQIAQAISKAQLFDAEHSARQEAESAHSRAVFLLEASIVLSSSLEYRKTLEQLSDLAVPRMCDWISVDLEDARIVRPTDRIFAVPANEQGDPRGSHLFADGPASLMVVPLIARDRVFGRITFAALESGRRYRSADLEMAELLGRRAGIAIDTAKLYEAEARTRARAERIADRMQGLQEAIAAVGESLTLDAIFATALEHACAAINCDAGWVMLLDEHGRELVLTAHRGVPPELVEANRRVPKSDAFPNVVPDLGISVPMLIEGRTIGVFSFGCFKSRLQELDREDWSFLQVLARQCAHATLRARLYDALREADRRKDEFLAVLAHELRNPLAPIRSAVGVLRMRGPKDEVISHARDVIDRQAAHMTRMVDDLLDVSRISQGKILLKEEAIDLVEVVRSTIEDHRAIVESNKLELTLRVPDEPLWTLGDRTRLAQVIGNLVHNATKFTEAGGAIDVDVKGSAGYATIIVRDNGTGIRPDLLDRIFEPFSQEERSLARTRGGLGLGLALVKGLVELHAGTVYAASEGPGRGAELTVRLPLREIRVERRHEAEEGFRAARPLSVLVIEDNEDAADMLATLLQLSGHTVDVASDGREGIEVARRLKPDLVLCDIGLPGALDGYAVAKALREDPQTSPSYLVALTGYGQEEDRARARAAGFDVHATKPLDADRLLEIMDVVSRDHLRRE